MTDAKERVKSIHEKLGEARESGHYLVLILSIGDGKMRCFRSSHQFPNDALPQALQMVRADLESVGSDTPFGKKV